MMGVLNGLARSFSRSLTRFPFITNMFVTGSIYAAGDISQQLLRGNTAPDFRSAARIGTVGGCVLAPMYVPWYRMLDYFLPGKAVSTIIMKCLCDQIIFSPITLSSFYIANSFLERKNDKFASLREQGLRSYLTACLFWPPVQAVNFLLIPGHYRTVYIASVSFVWTNILCYIKSKSNRPKTNGPDLEAIRSN